ncbi:MAG: hypothetical protein H7301_06075 [Cryobacterium sp.]|nr:hypothetical protein [Oligoflexia bacterium]
MGLRGVVLSIGLFFCAGVAHGATEVESNDDLPEVSVTLSSWSLIPTFSMTSLSSTDSQTGKVANATSAMNPRITAEYSMIWTHKFRSYARIGMAFIKFDRSNDSLRDMSSPSQFTSLMALGGVFEIAEKFRVDTYLGYRKGALLRWASPTSLGLDVIDTPIIGATLESDLVTRGIGRFGVKMGLEATSAAETDAYHVKMGTMVSAGFYLLQRTGTSMSNDVSEVSVEYYRRRQDSTWSEQRESGVTFSWKTSLQMKSR